VDGTLMSKETIEDATITVGDSAKAKIHLPKKPRTIELPVYTSPSIGGFRKPRQNFPKFGISGKQAQMAMCLADGQPLASHSKKNLARHFIWVQNNYIESEKRQSDLRLVIGRYEKKYGKLQESKKGTTGKGKKTKPEK